MDLHYEKIGEHWFPRQISDLATENHFVNVNRLIERSFFESLIEQSRLGRLPETVLCHHQMTFCQLFLALLGDESTDICTHHSTHTVTGNNHNN